VITIFNLSQEETQKKVYTEWLFYEVLKQHSNFELQIQNQNGYMSKRKSVWEGLLSTDNYEWFKKANARTILKNEIVIDIDPREKETFIDFENRCEQTLNILISASQEGRFEPEALFLAGHSGSRGYHIHIFIRKWLTQEGFKKEELRKNYRAYICEKLDADKQKTSERVTISLELAPHWKTGIIKKISHIGLIGLQYEEAFEELKEIVRGAKIVNRF